MPTNTVEKPSNNYLEELLQRAVVDSAFRDELVTNLESFGIPSDTKLVLPTAVATQEESGIELNDDIAGELGIIAACQTSCTTGPYTIVCDGSTK
jgi:hypothetical protein